MSAAGKVAPLGTRQRRAAAAALASVLGQVEEAVRGPAVVLVLDPQHPFVREHLPGVTAAYERWPAQHHASVVTVVARGGTSTYSVADGRVDERVTGAND